MLYWAFAFLVIALIAALFGFTGIAAGAVLIAKVLFFIFLAMFVAVLIAAIWAARSAPPQPGQERFGPSER